VAAPATEHPWHPLTDAAFLRAALASALRAAGITVAAVALSVAININAVPRELQLPFAIVYILVWIAFYAFYIRHKLRQVQRSPFPTLLAWETLLVGIVIFITIFANAYYLMSQADGGAFTQELDLFTSYYFTVTVLGTVGFGDITPVTVPARSVAMIQMVIDIGFVAVTVRLLTREVRISGAKRSSDTSPS